MLPFRGFCRPVRNTLTSPMDLLVQDQGYLLARDLTDKKPVTEFLRRESKHRGTCYEDTAGQSSVRSVRLSVRPSLLFLSPVRKVTEGSGRGTEFGLQHSSV